MFFYRGIIALSAFLLLSVNALKSPPRIDGVVSTQSKTDSLSYKLPTNVIPLEYNILLDPSLSGGTFHGECNIKVNVIEATKTITFHAAEIKFLETIVIDAENFKNYPLVARDDEEKQFRILEFENELPVGKYDLWISYSGVLRDDGYGFYKSSYRNSDGETRLLAATQFEPTYARYAFPCFDEPALKATFTISIIRNGDYNSISNMANEEPIELSDGRYQDTFKTTPLISTYLIAFVVSDFKYVNSGKLRVYSTPEHITSGDANFALEVSLPTVMHLEDYTLIPYPLEKLYQIAVPSMGGAMENWGLVTYSESGLLYQNNENTAIQKQATEVVIAHEFVHQWFGDLVGPSWWSYLWLNEGFASFLQYKIGGKVKPEWRLPEQHLVSTIQPAMDVDSFSTTRPMTQDAGSPTEIANLFDTIAYGKSGAVLRMLETAIGETTFRQGLKIYLTKMGYSTATGDDLWNSIQEALDSSLLPDDLTIPKIMKTWENQAGYPVVWVKRDYETGSVSFTQERFLLNDNNHILEDEWYIPVNYVTKSDLNFDTTTATNWLQPNINLVLNLRLNSEDFLIVNKQYGGYYRTNYDDSNWELIASYLNTDDFQNIPPLTRAGLINDAFLLARSGRLRYSIALKLTTYLDRETDYIPLKSFFNSFNSFNEMFNGLDNYHRLESKVSNALERTVKLIGIEENEEVDEDTEHINILNRNQLIQWACMFGSKYCREQTTQKLSSLSLISLDLRDNVLCAGIRGADFATWKEIYDRSLTEEDASLKASLNNALSCSENEEVLNWYVENALQSGNTVFSNILLSGNYGIKYSFKYLVNNIQKIYEALGTDITANVITSISKFLSLQSQLEKLQNLMQENKIEELESALAAAVQTVKDNVELTESFVDDVSDWINELEEDDEDVEGSGDEEGDENDDDENSASERVLAFSAVAVAILVKFISY